MSSLNQGFSIKTNLGGTVIVDKFLAEGGEGEVYLVTFNDEKKALKWYKKGRLGDNPTAFYDNILHNVKKGAPSEEFLWPVDITEWHDGTFGYIMPLKPANYYEITDFMLCKQRFKSYKRVVDAALHIVSAFRILHNAGYSYQDLNDGNFFINPDTGDVRICDCDNIAPDGKETGIMGKPRYIAPEIVLRQRKPNNLSDRFSMSLILYILFCLDHPLEGKRHFSVPCLTPEIQEKFYGSDPLFMWDAENTSNAPHRRLNRNSLAVWPCLPDYMKEIFTAAFSKEAFSNPAARPKEIEWLKALTRFRSDIVMCSCGNEIFTQQGRPCECDSCRKMADIPFRLELSGYSIPAVRGTRVYRCQLGVCHEQEALLPITAIIARKDNPSALGLRNMTSKSWDAVTSKGVAKEVQPDGVIPLKDGITFTAFKAPIAIKAN